MYGPRENYEHVIYIRVVNMTAWQSWKVEVEYIQQQNTKFANFIQPVQNPEVASLDWESSTVLVPGIRHHVQVPSWSNFCLLPFKTHHTPHTQPQHNHCP